jgi:hypothetical protein
MIYLVVFVLEFRTFHLLGRQSIIRAYFPSLSTLAISQIRFHIYTLAGLVHDPHIYASQLARMTGACHHSQLFIGYYEGLKIFCPSWL